MYLHISTWHFFSEYEALFLITERVITNGHIRNSITSDSDHSVLCTIYFSLCMRINLWLTTIKPDPKLRETHNITHTYIHVLQFQIVHRAFI